MRRPGDSSDALERAKRRIVFLEKQLQAERHRTTLERQRSAAHEATARAVYARMTSGRSRVADDPTD